jgi:hypothetical protein
MGRISREIMGRRGQRRGGGEIAVEKKYEAIIGI